MKKLKTITEICNSKLKKKMKKKLKRQTKLYIFKKL